MAREKLLSHSRNAVIAERTAVGKESWREPYKADDESRTEEGALGSPLKGKASQWVPWPQSPNGGHKAWE